MSGFQWKESHVKWFINFFTGKGDIKASSFGREDIPGIGRKPISKQDRHNLMELVVKKGSAIAVVGKPSYCIRLIPEDTEKHHFNQQMLFDDRINNLPEIEWLNSKEVSLIEWLFHKTIWLEIINLLRVYQVKGQISEVNLKQEWNSQNKKFLLIKAKEKIKLYSLLCFVWEQHDHTLHNLYQTPQDCFLDMLSVTATLMLSGDEVHRNKSARQKYEDLRQI